MRMASLRGAFGDGLVAAASRYSNIVVLSADLTPSIKFDNFAKEYPERFFEVGIAEQNLVASGMAHMGKIPFIGSYAAFSPGRNWEQIRTTVCLNDVPVKIIGFHAGVSVGPDGATHQALEDIALMRVLPNMVVIAPGDATEAAQLPAILTRDKRPNYVRLPRPDLPLIFDESHKFKIGKSYKLRKGRDITLLGTGSMSGQLLIAAEILAKKNIDCEVIHMPTIKPLDTSTIIDSVKKTGLAVTCEEHQVAGGFGSAVAEVLTDKLPRPLLRIGIDDEFGQSGQAEELLDFYGLTPERIADRIKRFLKGQSML